MFFHCLFLAKPSYLVHILFDLIICLNQISYFVVTVDDGRVITIKPSPNLRIGKVGKLLGQIHNNMTRSYVFCASGLRHQFCLRHVKITRPNTHNQIHADNEIRRILLNLNRICFEQIIKTTKLIGCRP